MDAEFETVYAIHYEDLNIKDITKLREDTIALSEHGCQSGWQLRYIKNLSEVIEQVRKKESVALCGEPGSCREILTGDVGEITNYLRYIARNVPLGVKLSTFLTIYPTEDWLDFHSIDIEEANEILNNIKNLLGMDNFEYEVKTGPSVEGMEINILITEKYDGSTINYLTPSTILGLFRIYPELFKVNALDGITIKIDESELKIFQDWSWVYQLAKRAITHPRLYYMLMEILLGYSLFIDFRKYKHNEMISGPLSYLNLTYRQFIANSSKDTLQNLIDAKRSLKNIRNKYVKLDVDNDKFWKSIPDN